MLRDMSTDQAGALEVLQGDKTRKPHRRFIVSKSKIFVADVILSLTVVTPLVVMFWRGSYDLMTVYSLPVHASLLLSILLQMVFLSVRDVFEKCAQKDKYVKKSVGFFLCRRTYTYVSGLVGILHWWSAWTALDQLLAYLHHRHDIHTVKWNVVIVLLSTLVLVVAKSLRNSSSPPLILFTDSSDTCYRFPTRFNVKVSTIYLIHSPRNHIVFFLVKLLQTLFLSGSFIIRYVFN